MLVVVALWRFQSLLKSSQWDRNCPTTQRSCPLSLLLTPWLRICAPAEALQRGVLAKSLQDSPTARRRCGDARELKGPH